MMKSKVLIYPNPILKKISKKVEEKTQKIEKIINDLVDIRNHTDHSTGIAAPQIGESIRIIAVDPGKNKKCKKHHGKNILINPNILKWEGTILGREGCMSVPDFTGNVNRARKIVVQFLDINFNENVIETDGFESILLQHEIDHLNGILFIDRVISKRTDLFRRNKKV